MTRPYTVPPPSDVASEIGAQLRRRRAASQRLERLECGHSDPLSCLAEFEAPPAAAYCCSALGLEQSVALARMGRRCSEATCARLLASAS